MKFSFLVENKTDNPGIMAEHGLSIYIETSEKRIFCGLRRCGNRGAADGTAGSKPQCWYFPDVSGKRKLQCSGIRLLPDLYGSAGSRDSGAGDRGRDLSDQF